MNHPHLVLLDCLPSFSSPWLWMILGAVSVYAQVDPDVPFLDTSPSNGVVSFDPYVKRFGKVWNPQFGDVHFYNYKDNCLDYTIYPRAKFISEFGFQSYPSFSVYEEVSSPEDWSYGSKLSSFRWCWACGGPLMLPQPWCIRPSIAKNLYNPKQIPWDAEVLSDPIHKNHRQADGSHHMLLYMAAIKNSRWLNAICILFCVSALLGVLCGTAIVLPGNKRTSL